LKPGGLEESLRAEFTASVTFAGARVAPWTTIGFREMEEASARKEETDGHPPFTDADRGERKDRHAARQQGSICALRRGSRVVDEVVAGRPLLGKFAVSVRDGCKTLGELARNQANVL